jgi:class 3 adenylate cyclase
VLFADLVGFTPMSESRDPEQVRELLSQYFARCRQVVTAYDGVIEKFIGDAVMAVWGVPVAHEDDAERAVRAGVDLASMVAALGGELGAPMALRVGIVTGEVAATLGSSMEGMVAGDPVNTASRVQAAAVPGQVWVDDATRSLTAHAVEFADAGEHTLKGKTDPMRLFAVTTVRAKRVAGGGLEVPMAGRESELSLMRDLFAAAVSDRRPRLIVVDGDAGVGKSRLVQEFERWLDDQPILALWHRGRCLSYGEGVAFRALTEAVRTRLGLVEGETGAIVTERLDATVFGLHTDPDEQAWLRPRLGLLVGETQGGTFERGELFAAWTRVLELVGDGHPVVLVIDDAHHADDGLLDFVDHVMDTTRTAFVVIAMTRPELLDHRPGWGGRHAAVIPLHPLPDDAMDQLLAALLAGAPAATREALVARAGGNPLFAIETVRSLVDERLAVVQDGRARLTPGATLSLDSAQAPATLRSLVRARLDALSEPERHLVANAAVLGLTFTLDGLAALAVPGDNLTDTVASLRRREILTIEDDAFSGERGQLRFVHALVRQVAYDTLSRRDRKTRHLAAADHLAALSDDTGEVDAIVAQHLLDAVDAAFDDDPDRDRLTGQAIQRLTSAAEQAAILGAPIRARQDYERAASLTHIDHERATLRVKAANSAIYAGDQVDAITLATEALNAFDALGDPFAAADALVALTRALNWAGRYAEMDELLRRRVPDVEATPGTERQVFELLENTYVAAVNIRGFREGGEIAQRLFELGRDSPDAAMRWSAYMSLASVCELRNDRIGTIAAYEECIRIARLPGATTLGGTPLINLSVAVAPEDLGRSLAIAREAITIARRNGTRNQWEWAQASELESLFLLGRFREMGHALDGLAIDDLRPMTYYLCTAQEAWHAAATGSPLPNRALDRPIESVVSQISVASGRLATATADGTVHAAEAAALDIVSLLPSISGGDVMWDALPLPAHTAVTARNHELASRLLDVIEQSPSEVTRMRRAFEPWMRGKLHATLGRATETVEIDLRNAIPELKAFGALAYAALAEADLGCWLLSQGHDDDATYVLEQAAGELDETGALGWRRAVEHRRSMPDPWSGT